MSKQERPIWPNEFKPSPRKTEFLNERNELKPGKIQELESMIQNLPEEKRAEAVSAMERVLIKMSVDSKPQKDHTRDQKARLAEVRGKLAQNDLRVRAKNHEKDLSIYTDVEDSPSHEPVRMDMENRNQPRRERSIKAKNSKRLQKGMPYDRSWGSDTIRKAS